MLRCAGFTKQVDAHNVVPVWTASEKQETGARTIRPKIERLLSMLTDMPPLEANAAGTALPEATDWDAARASLDVDTTVGEVKASARRRRRAARHASVRMCHVRARRAEVQALRLRSARARLLQRHAGRCMSCKDVMQRP
jgi:hypothetical protein